MARCLLAEIGRVTDKPVHFLINIHSHPDHVDTNHLFPGATVISSHRGREATDANRKVQGKHDALFARLFSDVDLSGGRYTLQDMSFSDSLYLYQGEREVCVLELGVGHSESDVVVHLPKEKIVFCGDIFMNGMMPMPGEGHVTETIADYKAIEALEADIYVAGHGETGTLDDVRAQRTQLERQFKHARECFEQGMSYDAALQAAADDNIPLDFQRLIILASYCEFAGKLPASTDPASIALSLQDFSSANLDRERTCGKHGTKVNLLLRQESRLGLGRYSRRCHQTRSLPHDKRCSPSDRRDQRGCHPKSVCSRISNPLRLPEECDRYGIRRKYR